MASLVYHEAGKVVPQEVILQKAGLPDLVRSSAMLFAWSIEA